MHNDFSTAETDSPTLLMGADRKAPPEKWALPMVRPTLATSIAKWETATFGGDWDCRDCLKEGIDWQRKEIAAYTRDCFEQA